MKNVTVKVLYIVSAGFISGNVIASDRITDEPVIPVSAKTHSDFVPHGWDEKVVVEADLNGDQRDDVAMVISWASRPPGDVDFKRKEHVLVLALRQDDGSLKRSAVSDGAILDDFEGGVLGYPFQELRVERGAVVIEHYGGSRNRWEITTRYRYEKGHWVLIGRTDVDTDVHYPDFIDKVDHNMSTGLVLRNFKSGGLSEENLDPVQRSLLRHPEVRYWRLPAPMMSQAPPLNGTPTTSDWGFHSLTLNRKEQAIANPEEWGPADLSATLRAVTTGEGLFLRAEVTDDQVTSEDGVRLTSLHGDEIKPGTMTRTTTATGYVMGMSWSKAQLRDALGEDAPYWLDPDRGAGNGSAEMEELPVTIEIYDANAGQPEVVLSTRPVGTPYAASILICTPSDLVLSDQ